MIFDFVLFFLTGTSVGVVFISHDDSEDQFKPLVDVTSMVPVCVDDTALLMDTSFNAAGLIYPAAVMYLERPYQVRDGMVMTRVLGWIYFENIYKTHGSWLVLKDENLRVRNNLVRIGRVFKNTRLEARYSPEGFIWNLVSFKGFVPIRQLRPYLDRKDPGLFTNQPSPAITTDLTVTGSAFPSRRNDVIPFNIQIFTSALFIVVMFFAFFLYFRNTGRTSCPNQLALLFIDLIGFASGLSLVMLL